MSQFVAVPGASQDAFNSLSNQLGNVSSGLKAVTNVSIVNAYKGIAGTIFCYNLRLSFSAAFSADTDLVTGFETPALSANGGAVGLGFNNANRNTKTFYLSSAGNLRCAESITSGEDYRINLVYRH